VSIANEHPTVGLHVGQLLQRVPGGIGRYVRHLLDALRAEGVPTLPFAAGDPSDHQVATLPGFVGLGWPYGTLRYELWHRLRRPKVRLPVSVLHAPSLAVPPTDLPLVVTVNDVAFVHHADAFTRRGLAFHRRGLTLARRDADAVVVPTEFTRDELVIEGFARDRIFVAHHGVTSPPAQPSAETDGRVERVGVAPPYVLAVGTIEPRKNLPLLADAVERARSRHAGLGLVLAGPRGWLDVPGLDRPWVREVGPVDDPTRDALYRRAVAYAMPSRYEGFGMPVLEAMANGCPVIAADTTSLPEVVGSAGLLLRPDDVDAWSDAIARLLADPEERARLAGAGRERAATFTWAASAADHLRAYADALERARS
jgi:glycosyltransferase involved in cell wall biosynthesis